MAVRLRLARAGAKKRPFYRIVAANVRDPRDGRFLEKLGTYDPIRASDDPDRLKLDEERIRFWLANGATPTERVARFLDKAGILPGATKLKATGKRAAEIEAKKAAAEAGASA